MNAHNPLGWRPTMGNDSDEGVASPTVSGDRGLMLESQDRNVPDVDQEVLVCNETQLGVEVISST